LGLGLGLGLFCFVLFCFVLFCFVLFCFLTARKIVNFSQVLVSKNYNYIFYCLEDIQQFFSLF
jgi:hypothetical protein